MNDMPEIPTLRPGVAEALANGTLNDPFGVLGPHDSVLGRLIRVFVPGAIGVDVLQRDGDEPLGRLAPAMPHGLFAGQVGPNGVRNMATAPLPRVQHTFSCVCQGVSGPPIAGPGRPGRGMMYTAPSSIGPLTVLAYTRPCGRSGSRTRASRW